MFLTTSSSRLYEAWLEAEEMSWAFVELDLPQSLLLLSILDTTSGHPLRRTFVTRLADFGPLLAEGHYTVTGVSVMSPPRVNSAGRWKLETLVELWRCTDIAGDEAWKVVVPGRTYADSWSTSNPSHLNCKQCIFTTSVPNALLWPMPAA